MNSVQLAPAAIARAATKASAKAMRSTLSFQVIPNSPLGFTNYCQTQPKVCAGPGEIECSQFANNR